MQRCLEHDLRFANGCDYVDVEVIGEAQCSSVILLMKLENGIGDPAVVRHGHGTTEQGFLPWGWDHLVASDGTTCGASGRLSSSVRACRIYGVELLRELAGSEQHFVQLLTDQIRVTIQGARLVRDVVAGRELDTDFREQMQTVEREGDTYRAELASTLSSALVTPIDREDLFRSTLARYR